MPADRERLDEVFMGRALELAARGLGRTSPNPAVGAVVVGDGEIVGEGFHERAGAPHAEPNALAEAGERAHGATLYVSLEPCRHHGRTPPCTEAIIRAGIRRVVYACEDCDDRCAGQGARTLTEAGIEVACGPLAEQARRLNEAYFKHKRTGLPFVTVKLALSLDGKTATADGESRWITGPAARERVHRMRDHSDAVMVGIGTVRADDPALTTRLPGGRDALRVIVDSGAYTPPTARVVAGTSAAPCLVAVSPAAPEECVAALQAAGAETLVVPFYDSPHEVSAMGLDLQVLLAELGRRDIMSILLEGGPTLAAGALGAGLVDKLVLFYAPLIIGGADALPALGDLGVMKLTDAPRLRITAVERVGEDMLVEAYPCSRD